MFFCFSGGRNEIARGNDDYFLLNNFTYTLISADILVPWVHLERFWSYGTRNWEDSWLVAETGVLLGKHSLPKEENRDRE